MAWTPVSTSVVGGTELLLATLRNTRRRERMHAPFVLFFCLLRRGNDISCLRYPKLLDGVTPLDGPEYGLIYRISMAKHDIREGTLFEIHPTVRALPHSAGASVRFG